jgi:hypothetical protein
MEQEEYDFNMPWTAGGKDVISQEMEMAKTNSELKIKEVPPGVAAKHKSVKNDYKSQPITSWFQRNKHSNNTSGSEINENRQKRYMEADEKAEALQSKYSRIRKGSSYIAMQNAEKAKLAAANTISTPTTKSSTSSQSSDLTFSSGGYRTSESVEDSQENTDEIVNLGVPSVRASKAANTIVSKSKTYIPSIPTQVAKIEQVRYFDLKFGTCHAEVLKATKYGVQCEVCDVTLTDLSCILRMDDSVLRSHCHLGSKTHISNLDNRKTSKMRQPSLITILSEITPNVDQKVKLFRFDLTKLLLSLRVSLNSVNKVAVLSEQIIPFFETHFMFIVCNT